jgi:ABC-type dipeptide/oligopeptide/nickel transport system permease component
MVSFLIKRMGFALFTLFSVLTLVFVIVRVLPGDPALVILGDQASPAVSLALQFTSLVWISRSLSSTGASCWVYSRVILGHP